MTKAKRILLASVGVMAVGLASAPTLFAGQKAARPVQIFRNSAGQITAVAGSLGSVHNSPDNVQFLQCNFFGGSTPSVECDGRDAAGTQISCFTQNPSTSLANAVQSITSTSYIEFDLAQPGTSFSGCATVVVNNSSFYQAPTTN